MYDELNLYQEILDSMKRFDFEQKNIDAVANNPEFIKANNNPSSVQKTIITMVFFGIMVNTETPAPAHIRIALNVATDVRGWLDDMNNTILPWLKANEDVFFP
jgi:hypothetical protein